jgi:hypothetical protein
MVVTVARTPVRVHRSVLVNLVGGWVALSFLAGKRHPERPPLIRLGMGALSIALIMAADVGHALAHGFGARRAGAPMDAIEVSANMPRTVYYNNDVPPQAHRGRAIGGPIYSALGLLTGLVAHGVTERSSAARELADWWSIGNGLIFFGSLTPTPSVDGGSLLKWHLVARGGDEQAAEREVRRAGLATGGVLIGAGIGLCGWPAKALSARFRRLGRPHHRGQLGIGAEAAARP